MNVWPFFIAVGRLGVIWIADYHKRKIFLTIVTMAFMMYHFHIEMDKLKKYERIEN
tara:strand:+ start:18756 stop:18923 length:168 start_codon:yes stop_codon:yes gene_type:complete